MTYLPCVPVREEPTPPRPVGRMRLPTAHLPSNAHQPPTAASSCLAVIPPHTLLIIRTATVNILIDFHIFLEVNWQNLSPGGSSVTSLREQRSFLFLSNIFLPRLTALRRSTTLSSTILLPYLSKIRVNPFFCQEPTWNYNSKCIHDRELKLRGKCGKPSRVSHFVRTLEWHRELDFRRHVRSTPTPFTTCSITWVLVNYEHMFLAGERPNCRTGSESLMHLVFWGYFGG